MATTLDPCGCVGATAGRSPSDAMLPISPFTALQYHFGMLLGVDDLETAQGYPLGKIRLHNAWLHREGVVWGFGVEFNERRELSVLPGFALDAAGHELHLDVPVCCDLGKWYEKHADDPAFTFEDAEGGGRRFVAHVVARFRACLARPVPAIADPCAGSEVDTAYSRVSEMVEVCLRPGPAVPKDRGYHRLRVLFSLEPDAAEYDAVRTRREQILALPAAQQPRAYLDAFREFAALDEIALAPPKDAGGATTSIFPEDPTEVVLADLGPVVVRRGASGWALADPLPVLDVGVRPAHVATATIQELLCGPLFATSGGPPEGGPVEQPPVDAGGPRIDPASVSIAQTRRIVLTADKPLDRESVQAEQFSVTAYTTSGGWRTLEMEGVAPDAAGITITIRLKESVTRGSLVRVIARGTGPTPLLGADLVPLAGAVGGPPGSAADGHDFVTMLRRS